MDFGIFFSAFAHGGAAVSCPFVSDEQLLLRRRRRGGERGRRRMDLFACRLMERSPWSTAPPTRSRRRRWANFGPLPEGKRGGAACGLEVGGLVSPFDGKYNFWHPEL